MPAEETEGFENIPSPERETDLRGATSQESNDPEESDENDEISDEVSDGAPDAGVTEEREPPARLPEAEMEEASPTEPSGEPRGEMTAEDLQKQKEAKANRLKQGQQEPAMAEARAQAAETAAREAHARMIAAEKAAIEMEKRKIAAEKAMIEIEKKKIASENELLRQRRSD